MAACQVSPCARRPPIRPQVKKARVQISFAGRSLTTLQLEIAPPDTGDEEFTEISAADLTAVGLQGPDVVLGLALEALNPALLAVRDGLRAVRGQHAWPPTVTVQASWPAAYRVLADGLGFPVNDAADAVRAIQQFVARIAAA
jgi:hypothetical protein